MEGPRNSGKTTAVKRVMSAYPEGAVSAIKFHRTSNPPLFMTKFLAEHYLALIDSRSIVVLDRFHLTEFVMRSLDKKVSPELLLTTTHMVDAMLKECDAVVYFVDTKVEVRKERLKGRDPEHAVKEWEDYAELDKMWAKALKTFKECKTKVMPGNTKEDIDRIVLDIMMEQKTITKLNEKIPFYPPKIENEALMEYGT